MQTFVLEQGTLLSEAEDVTVNGGWKADLPGAQGDPSSFTVGTNVLGLAELPGKRGPATWTLTWVTGGGVGNACDGRTQTLDVTPDSIAELVCHIFTSGSGTSGSLSPSPSSFSFSPNPLNTSNVPAQVTITGHGLSAQYGMPLVQYFDLSGTLIEQDNAQSVASDGTWLKAATPDVSQLLSGSYAGFISNAKAAGGWDLMGAVSVTVMTPSPPPCGKPRQPPCGY